MADQPQQPGMTPEMIQQMMVQMMQQMQHQQQFGAQPSAYPGTMPPPMPPPQAPTGPTVISVPMKHRLWDGSTVRYYRQMECPAGMHPEQFLESLIQQRYPVDTWAPKQQYGGGRPYGGNYR